jgi:NADH-quinone oxidoreductase subunit K
VTVPNDHLLVLAACLFAIGVTGFFLRRNVIVVLMSIELMLNAANLALVAFGQRHGTAEGQALVFFVMCVAAAEVAVGLAIIVAIFRQRRRLSVDELSTLRG